MLRDVFGLIYAGEENPNLRDLVLYRSVAALPLGGRYRAIDFLLSSMVNSGISNIGVITQKNYKSLMDHVGSGKEWGLNRKNGGLFMLPPFDTANNTHIYKGICDAINSKLDYIRRSPQQYCLLSGSYTVCSADFEPMMRAHLDNHADITMMYSDERLDFPGRERFKDVRLQVDEDGRVRGLEMDNNSIRSPKLGMDLYLINKALLEFLVQGAVGRGEYKFVSDVIIPNLHKLRVFAVPHQGRANRLNSIASYYELNMEMITPELRRDLFRPGRPVYTKIKDEPPVKYLDAASAQNCIMGDGCEVAGRVENSVLFRGVSVGRGAKVTGSIIMQETEIGEDCQLENVIVDKYARLRRGVRLVGAPEFPVIIRKGAVI